MAADDPYQQQWNLRPRIDALRAEATSLRRQNNEQFTSRMSELGIERDRIAREHDGVAQSAKSADTLVKAEQDAFNKLGKDITAREAKATAAERRGDVAEAAEIREFALGLRAVQETHTARARQATLDAAELRERAAGIDRRLKEKDLERDDLSAQTTSVEKEIDKLEQQADLLQEARLKWSEADLTGDDVAGRSTLELEAEALVARAGAIGVDRTLIRTVIPELPDTTPGIDDPAGPLPEGAVDWSEFIESSAAPVDVLGEDVATATGENTLPAEGSSEVAVAAEASELESQPGGSVQALAFEESITSESANSFEQLATFDQPMAFEEPAPSETTDSLEQLATFDAEPMLPETEQASFDA
jgi:hypothetical protein